MVAKMLLAEFDKGDDVVGGGGTTNADNAGSGGYGGEERDGKEKLSHNTSPRILAGETGSGETGSGETGTATATDPETATDPDPVLSAGGEIVSSTLRKLTEGPGLTTDPVSPEPEPILPMLPVGPV